MRSSLPSFGSSLALCLALGLAPLAHADTPAARQAAQLNNIGTALMNQQQLDLAAAKFVDALKVDPALSVARVNEGIADLYAQKLDDARTALQAATAAAPDDPHGWYTLGLLDRAQSQSPAALEAFRKVLAIDPGDADAHYMAASIEVDLNDLPAATAEYRQALAASPNHASSLFGLARALRRQGDAAGAQQVFAQFQQVSAAKASTPLSHNYGEEGRYARVEDAVLTGATVGPMIPVTYKQSWRSPGVPDGGRNPSTAGAPQSTGGVCLLSLSSKAPATLAVVGAGEQAVRLLRYTASGFAELPAAQTGLHAAGTGLACAVGDYDNDGLPDLAIAVKDGAGKPRILLFHNLGGDRFEEVAARVGIAAANQPTGLLFVDFDHDGDLDLFVTGAPLAPGGAANTLFRNNGNKTFTDWTAQAGLGGTALTAAATLSDLNNDRAVDLLTVGAAAAPTWFVNRREGPFGVTPLYTAALPPTTSIQALDFNKDDWMDVLVTHSGAPGVSLWRNVEGHSFARVPLPLPGVIRAMAAVPLDFDNDGWLDLALLVETAKGPELRMLRNLGPAGFIDVSAALKLPSLALHNPRGLLAADFDRSGAAGLLVTEADGGMVLLANQGGNRHHALAIALTGLADNKSGVGTKVEVFANGLRQKWEATGQPEILAGLGTADKADFVRLLWPTGVPQDELDISAAKPFDVTELDRRGSSCPTLFAWDGAGYRFVSDVIGAGVVGHWTSPTQHNIPDPDEWIKVDGRQVRPRDGLISLRFGEPMEEVNFVDQVRLVAVDHPAATAVYPHEGFLSEPPFARAGTIAAAHAHPLAMAVDDRGRNVLPLLSQPLRTGFGSGSAPAPEYVRDFTNLPFAGFASLHSLTIDLGPWQANRPLLLLLHGFIEYFSASSMYSAWQAGLAPIPPYVEAQLPDGSWHRIVGDMGFPAGLPRTVTVDLTGKVPARVTRLRITTNLQIYWDQALVDNESPADPGGPQSIRRTELPLTRATLAFRGYPRQIDGQTPGDLTYNYRQMSATGPFVPHRGAYTRYGDVTPLLHTVDDEFVIFGTGEDMDLEFRTADLPPLPAGWARDYFFYANGFVKDMDFYEASPFEVGALPFHGMSGYPYRASEHYPSDAAHTAYQLEYNTRFESGTIGRPFQFAYPAPTATTSAGAATGR